MENTNTIEINGVTYVRQDSIPPGRTLGNRVVAVLDRGWIFAGDLEESESRVTLHRAVQVRKWAGGFENFVSPDGWKFNGAVVSPMANGGVVEYPIAAELFRVPVDANWGLA